MIVKRCINCMEDMSSLEGTVCPKCGFNNVGTSNQQFPYAMCPNTILHGRYLVGNVLGQGGFGITYIGFDLVLSVKVAIKEYFPMGIVTREQSRSNTLLWNHTQVNTQQRQDGFESFLKEARKTAKIDSIPSIVRVRDTFFENETAYIIMDYVEGETLKSKLQMEGVMAVSDCIKLLTPMMEGLAQVHKMGIIHRDISPDNIMVEPNGSVKLLDLGAAKDMSSGQGQSQLVTKSGFSPMEQYTEAGQIGPWTDVYALCATVYYCITGKTVPSALDRIGNEEISFPADLKESLPAHVEAALRAGLAVESKNRIQDVEGFLERLKGGGTDSKTDSKTDSGKDSKDGTGKKARKSKKTKFIIGGVVAVLLLFLLIPWDKKETKDADSDTALETEAGTGAEEEPGTETAGKENDADTLRVEMLGTSNENMLNYGGNAKYSKEYEYFIAGDNALYVCPYNKEDSTFYVDSSEKVCESSGYITLDGESVYFLATMEETNAVCRMDKDGSNIVQLYSTTDGRDFRFLQYVKFTDESEYLYFVLENETHGLFGNLYRYDLAGEKVETVVEGDLYWYNLHEDSLYYTEWTQDGDSLTRLMKSGLDGSNALELESGKSFSTGFIAEDTLYMISLRDEALLVYDLDGTQKSGYDGFYSLDIDFDSNLGYGDGWIYYTSSSDKSIHRVRANGTGDSVFLEGHTAIQICYLDSWIWFVENIPTEKEHQYLSQAYYLYRDGSSILEIMDPDFSWVLQTENVQDFQYMDSEIGDGIAITGYTGNLTSFTIPDEIDGKKVTGIAEGAFQESSVVEVGLPKELKYVAKNAFYKCESLEFIGLPEGLETIGYGAFGMCRKLTYVDLPESLVTIGTLAFGETSLSKVYIPGKVESIGAGAFAILSGAGFTEFTSSEDNEIYLTYEGGLYQVLNEEYLLLLEYPSGCSGTFEIPDGIVGIHSYAFAHCKNLTEIVVPETVLVIGEDAFWDVTISEITISEECELKGDIGSDITVNYY